MIGLSKYHSDDAIPTVGAWPRRTVFLSAVIVFLAAFLIGPLPARAAKTITLTAKEVRGQVFIVMPNGQKKPLQKGDRVDANHVIESAPGGSAVLQMRDGSKVEVFGGTRIEINELLPEEESKFSISLFFGRIAAKLRKLKGDDVVITPTMVCGVRGTDFAVSVADDGASVTSVEEGTVEASTDKAWDKTASVSVEAGQEVQADESGAILAPRPIQIQSLEDFTQFRQQRLKAMHADLPKLIAGLEKGIDPNLAILDKIKALPLDRAKVLQELDKKLHALGPGDLAERAKLTIQTHMEAANILSLVKRFRIQRMRLRSTFVQSERLQSLLPSFADQLGDEYKTVDEGLKRILARKKEVRQKEDQIAREFKCAVAPTQHLIDKFKKPQFKLGD